MNSCTGCGHLDYENDHYCNDCHGHNKWVARTEKLNSCAYETPNVLSSVNKSCEHKYVKIQTLHTENMRIPFVEDLFYCEKCLDYQKKIRP